MARAYGKKNTNYSQCNLYRPWWLDQLPAMIFLKRLLNILFIPSIFLRYVQAEEIVNFFYNSKLKGRWHWYFAIVILNTNNLLTEVRAVRENIKPSLAKFDRNSTNLSLFRIAIMGWTSINRSKPTKSKLGTYNLLKSSVFRKIHLTYLTLFYMQIVITSTYSKFNI